MHSIRSNLAEQRPSSQLGTAAIVLCILLVCCPQPNVQRPAYFTAGQGMIPLISEAIVNVQGHLCSAGLQGV